MIFIYFFLDENQCNRIYENSNTHNITNTIENTELELTCDNSPRIIINNKEESYLNCDNNNHKRENGVSINQENSDFALRIRGLSTAAQLEKLLDDSCNHVTKSCDHVTNNSCNHMINNSCDHLTTSDLKGFDNICNVSKDVQKCWENCDARKLSQARNK